jgi:hypothetical protein
MKGRPVNKNTDETPEEPEQVCRKPSNSLL